MLHHNSLGNYKFLQGIEPYSCGVIADENFELVRVTMPQSIKWDAGFDEISKYLIKENLSIHALASIELRSPHVRSMTEFIEFNSNYINVMSELDLLINGLNPIARTNVVPAFSSDTETTLHAFSYTRPIANSSLKSFVVAGAGELSGSALDSKNIIRFQDTSQDGLSEKVSCVRDVMTDRLIKLGVGWTDVTTTSIYTVHDVQSILNESLLPHIHTASRFGLQFFPAKPPVTDIEFEMDTRGVHVEIFLPGK